MLLGSMNRQMNLPALQRIAMEFERENDVMDQRQEMMDDAIDEATGMEGEEEEGEDIVKEVLDEIGVDLNQSVGLLWAFHPIKDPANLRSWVRLQRIYRRRRLRRIASLSRLALEEAADLRPVMMTCKHDLTASVDDFRPALFCVHFSRFFLAIDIPTFLCGGRTKRVSLHQLNHTSRGNPFGLSLTTGFHDLTFPCYSPFRVIQLRIERSNAMDPFVMHIYRRF